MMNYQNHYIAIQKDLKKEWEHFEHTNVKKISHFLLVVSLLVSSSLFVTNIPEHVKTILYYRYFFLYIAFVPFFIGISCSYFITHTLLFPIKYRRILLLIPTLILLFALYVFLTGLFF